MPKENASEGNERRWSETDLRRRQKRAAAQELCRLAQYLPPEERDLVRVVFEDGKRVSDVARMSETDAQALRRRLKRVTTRLTSTKFRSAALALPKLGPTRRRVAETHVLAGRSLRETARELKLSLHTVRCHSGAIDAVLEDTNESASEIPS